MVSSSKRPMAVQNNATEQKFRNNFLEKIMSINVIIFFFNF